MRFSKEQKALICLIGSLVVMAVLVLVLEGGK
jgi:hypothetical protein